MKTAAQLLCTVQTSRFSGVQVTLGYHGCDKRTAANLLSGAPFELSNKSYDWLGTGAYFWEGDVRRAYEWALERRSWSPCVVGAVIDLGNCLDLTTRHGAEAVRSAHSGYIKLQRESGNRIPENRYVAGTPAKDIVLRYLDRAVIDHLHANNRLIAEKTGGLVPELDTVRALFPEGESLYPGAGFWEKTHIQIAVRATSRIRGVFRVPQHELTELGIPDVYEL